MPAKSKIAAFLSGLMATIRLCTFHPELYRAAPLADTQSFWSLANLPDQPIGADSIFLQKLTRKASSGPSSSASLHAFERLVSPV
ncbi:hypothetical protein QMZ05_28505 [Bradyrhizobium sp. INPA03-11B]|uniref:hypothetical protein n=1 Tax=Bradyrhizobium sp. INPA03-11B TaxID=418598 RepID=UPI00338E5E64